jgi:hypothetical protein
VLLASCAGAVHPLLWPVLGESGQITRGRPGAVLKGNSWGSKPAGFAHT